MSLSVRSAAVASVGSLLAVSLLSACAAASDGTISTSSANSSGTTSSGTASPLAPSSSAPAAALASFYDQQLLWEGCGGDFECSNFSVPLAYDDPGKASITLKLIRLASQGDNVLGSLVVNPGGPGGSGIDYARAARAVTTDAMRDHYDIVGFDPRGVGTSNPIHCLDDAQTDAYIAADASPDNAAETADLERLSVQLGAACVAKSPTLVPNIGTRDAARDMDILRAALGDDKLNYLGKSYGTYLGATYAEEFPANVGRMLLDGAVDPSLNSTELAKGQAAGFELALKRFVQKCPDLPNCPLSHDPAVAITEVQNFLGKVDAQPLTTSQGRPLTEALAVLGIIGSLYDNDYGWPTLADGLSAAFKGDGSRLLEIGDYFTDRDSSGHYTTNGNDAIYAVNCWDKPATPGLAETQELAKQWAVEYPTFGTYLAWGNLPCATWPGHSTVAPHKVVAEGSPTILVIGTTNDPATPVEWAKSLASQLSHGLYMEWQGDGHTAYMRGSTCIDDQVDSFFIDGVEPTAGTVCPAP